MRDKDISRKKVEELYFKKKMTHQQIADYFGVPKSAISSLITAWGFGRQANRLIPSKEQLEDLYWNQEMSIKSIAKQLNIAPATVSRYFKKYNIQTRKPGTNQFGGWDYSKVKLEFERRGYTLLSESYKNMHEKLLFRCPKGHEGSISFAAFHNLGHGCQICGEEKKQAYIKAERLRNYKKVKRDFEQKGCILLTTEQEYKNAHTKLDYICHCGAKAHITYSNFKQGNSCANCKRLRFTGENNHNWNPNLSDDDRLELGRYEERYKAWKRNVFMRDHFTCQVCSRQTHKNVVHHLDSYSDYPELRTDPDNGVTLCEDCHKAFHSLFGYGHNTKEQFQQFKKEYEAHS